LVFIACVCDGGHCQNSGPLPILEGRVLHSSASGSAALTIGPRVLAQQTSRYGRLIENETWRQFRDLHTLFRCRCYRGCPDTQLAESRLLAGDRCGVPGGRQSEEDAQVGPRRKRLSSSSAVS